MMRRFLPVAAVAVLVAAGGLSATAHAAKKLTIVASVPSLGFPFFVHMMKEIRAEAAALGDIELLEMDGQNSTPKQSADVEAAIARGVDGIIISPLDSVAMAPALQEAVDAGIPVVTIDRRIDGVPGILAHVGADNVKGGEAQGKFIKDMFPNGARLVNLQGQPGSSPAIDRNKGVHNVLDGDSKYQIVAEQTAFFAREKGANVTEAILGGLDAPPDVIVAANDDMALGALQAVQEAGLAGKVKIIGFDALPEALAQVRDGGLAATIEQSPGGQSRGAMRALVSFLRDGKKPDKLTLLSPFAISKANLDKGERLSELK